MSGAGLAQAGEPYRLGVVPFLAPAGIEELYAPVAAELAKVVGRPVELRAAANFEKFMEALKRSDYDIALVHAVYVPALVDDVRYQPVARLQEPFSAVIATLESGPFTSLESLKGKVIAIPPNRPTVQLIQRLMREKGFDPEKDFTYVMSKGTPSCLQTVAIGDAAGCVTAPFALKGIATKLNLPFRRVVETAPIPNLTFVAHARVPAAEQRKLREGLVGWNTSEAGQRLLPNMQTRGLVPAAIGDYEALRQLLKP